MKKPIYIAGAGISGLTAGINLARAGYDVEIYEANNTIGKRFNNCFQILENYTEKEDVVSSLNKMNIDMNFFYHSGLNVDFYDSNLKCYHIKSSLPFGYFVKRGTDKDTIDQGIAKQALETGVKIIYNTKLDTEKFDIIATGPKLSSGISKEITFNTNIENCFRVILDNNIAPKGYTYLFVINKMGTIGSAILKNFSEINEYTKKAVNRFQDIEKFEMINPKTVVSYVDFYLSKSAVVENKLMIGEAAGFQDLLFGMGIRRSITSGHLAAKSLIENIDYDKLWKKEFLEKMQISIVNRFIYEFGGNFGYSLFNKYMQKSDLKEFGYSLYRPNLIKKSLFPFIKIIWKNYTKCLHGDNCQWCRRKQK